MNDTQPYRIEPEKPLQNEDDADCFEKSGIIEESARRTRNPSWCSSELCVLQMTSDDVTERKQVFILYHEAK